MHYRPYTPSDRDACIALFRSNVPRFFRDHELQAFTDFIDSLECRYFVVLDGDDGGEIVGCGGFGLQAGSDCADLCWGMVRRDCQGKRIGAYLLLVRLHAILTSTNAQSVRLGTSQYTEGFFRRYGFEIQSAQRDGIALGLDDVEMKLTLTAENRASIEREHREMVF